MAEDREEFYEVHRCDNCGYYAQHENWRCEHGMCVDGNPEPSFTLVEVVPKAQRDKAIAERDALVAALRLAYPYVRDQAEDGDCPGCAEIAEKDLKQIAAALDSIQGEGG